MKIITGLCTLLVLIFIAAAAFSSNGHFAPVILSLSVMAIYLPLVTYFGAIRNFNANARVSETIEYHFDDEYLSIKGESFNSQLTWNKIYKVTNTKNWIVIWHNRQVGNPVQKGNISVEEISYIKNILDIHNVKNNL